MAAAGHKLALGTVQFGLPYGISNQRGQVPPDEVTSILEYCRQKGIDLIDTATAYGNSEEVLGNCLPKDQNEYFRIISKLPAGCKPGEVATQVNNSLRFLQVASLYGYLYHDFNTYVQEPGTFDALLSLKEKSVIQHIGFSLYYPRQLEYLLQKDLSFNMVQIPFNVLDQRFAYLFPLLTERNIQVHVRSVFLQGLLLTPVQKVQAYFKPLIPALTQLQYLAQKQAISFPHLLLGFAHLFPAVTNLVVGVTSLTDLEKNIAYTDFLVHVEAILPDLKALAITDEVYLLPFNWKTT